jgi:acyl-CoA hydrolase
MLEINTVMQADILVLGTAFGGLVGAWLDPK